MEIWNAIVNFIVASVLMGTTLMYGTLGEILTEKSGNLNLGVEGLIYMGGGEISGIVDGRTTTKEEVGLLMTKKGEGEGI